MDSLTYPTPGWPGPDAVQLAGQIFRLDAGKGCLKAYMLLSTQGDGEGIEMRILIGPALTAERVISLGSQLLPGPEVPAEDRLSMEIYALTMKMEGVLTVTDAGLDIRRSL
jgi:hypothetical protein